MCWDWSAGSGSCRGSNHCGGRPPQPEGPWLFEVLPANLQHHDLAAGRKITQRPLERFETVDRVMSVAEGAREVGKVGRTDIDTFRLDIHGQHRMLDFAIPVI